MRAITHDEDAYYDFDKDELLTEGELRREFDILKAKSPDDYLGWEFKDYVNECCGKNGTLEVVHGWAEVFA